MGDMLGKDENHESFGMVGLSRISVGGGMRLFGSHIRHSTVIALRIKTAKKSWDLHQPWYFAKKEIIEVYMSPAQFAEAITGMNIGEGVPCTITHLNRKQMAECPDENVRELIERDFDDDMQQVGADAIQAIKEAQEVLSKKSITKTDLKVVIQKLQRIKTALDSNMPFIQKSFNKAMDKTVYEAKAEIDAFVTHVTMELGKEALAKQGLDVMLPDLDSPPKSIPE